MGKQVIIQGSTDEYSAVVDSSGALKVAGAATTAGTAQFVKLTDGTDTALVTTAGGVQSTLFSLNGNAISAEPDVNAAYHLDVQSGDTDVKPTLTAVTGNATGATVDGRTGRNSCTVIAVGTATLTGTLTIEISHDGAAWVSSGTTVLLTAAATVVATHSTHHTRFWRVSLSGSGGAGSCTATVMLV